MIYCFNISLFEVLGFITGTYKNNHIYSFLLKFPSKWLFSSVLDPEIYLDGLCKVSVAAELQACSTLVSVFLRNLLVS